MDRAASSANRVSAADSEPVSPGLSSRAGYCGRVLERLGTRLGYALPMVFWSLASMGHALGSPFTSFTVARSALGFSESGVFPASIKTVAEWFPKKERALATGIFNAGTNVGAIATPLA